MHQLVVIAASYRTTPVAEIGRLAIDRAELPRRLAELRAASGVQGLVYLGTCNRLELLLERAPGQDLTALRQSLLARLSGAQPCGPGIEHAFRIRAGEAALEHVLCVACGLDSARVGDREIASQLRDAWLLARSAGTSSRALDDLVIDALATARAVAGVAAPAGRPGYAERAVAQLLAGTSGEPRAPIALLGVSPMTRAAGRRLVQAGRRVLVVNRGQPARALLATELGAEGVSPDEFWSGARPVAALLCAVGTVERVADVAALRRVASASHPCVPVVVDLGVPENIGAEVAQAAGLPFLGMQQLVAVAAVEREGDLLQAAAVRELVARRVEHALRLAALRAAGPLVGALRANFSARAETELQGLLRGALAGLEAREAQALRDWALRLSQRMAHVPMQGLRALATRAEPELVDECLQAMCAALAGKREDGTDAARWPRWGSQ